MVGFDRPYFVIVVHDTSVESGCVLRVDGGGSCRSQRYVFGRFQRQRYVLTNHVCRYIRIVTVFVKNKTRFNLTRSVGKLLSCRNTSCTCLILCGRAGGRHCAFANFRPMSLSTASSTLGFCFFNLSAVVDGLPMTDATVEQNILPLPLLLPIPFPFSFP